MCTGTRFTQYSIQSNRFLCSCSWKKVLFKEDNAKFSGKVSVKKRGIAAIDSLPGFLLPFHYFFDRNKKSEPIPNQEKVRISFVWWRLRNSIADFALGGKIIWWQPVFELAVAICHRHIAFEWVRVPALPESTKTPPHRVVFLYWWRLRDSNLWPHACEACALTSWAKPP